MDSFRNVCRKNYYEEITPSNKSVENTDGYKKIVEIATAYFNNNEYDSFAEFLLEGSYFISLWAAHMLVEYGNPNHDLMVAAIKTIKEHSDNPLSPEVAKEEGEWMVENLSKYEKYLKFSDS